MEWFAEVVDIFRAYEVPEHIWRPIAHQESRLDPAAHNPGTARILEDSRGLFQINIQANPRYASYDLFNPAVNAEIAARDFIAPAYRAALGQGITDPGLQAEFVWRHGIRPHWGMVMDQGKDAELRQMAAAIYGQNVAPASRYGGGVRTTETPAGGGGIWTPYQHPTGLIEPGSRERIWTTLGPDELPTLVQPAPVEGKGWRETILQLAVFGGLFVVALFAAYMVFRPSNVAKIVNEAKGE